MFCKHCGARNRDDAQFCMKCGGAISLLDEFDPTVTVPAAVAGADTTQLLSDAGAAKVMADAGADKTQLLDGGAGAAATTVIGSGAAEAAAPQETKVFTPVDTKNDTELKSEAIGSLEATKQFDAPPEVLAAMRLADQPGGIPAKKSKRPMIIAIVIIVLIAAIGTGLGWWYHNQSVKAQQAEAAFNAAHQAVAVPVALDIPGYSSGKASPIPLFIEGTDLDGNAVSTTQYCATPIASVDLKRGEYTVSAAGAPVTSTGTIYDIPTDTVALTVDETGTHTVGSNGIEGDSITIVYTPIAPEYVTDVQIDDAYNWMIVSGMTAEEANGYRTAVVNARQAALDAIASGERAAADEARAQEDAARREANHYAFAHLSFDLPEYWWYRVDVLQLDNQPVELVDEMTFEESTTTATYIAVNLAGTDERIVYFVIHDAGKQVAIRDYSLMTVNRWTQGNTMVELIAPSMIPYALQESTGTAESQRWDLLTGGETPIEVVRDAGTPGVVQQAATESVIDYLERTLIPTVAIS